MKKVKILVVPGDKTAVGNFRSVKPHILLENKYPDEFFVDIAYEPNFDDTEFLKQYSIVHFHKKLGTFASTAHNIQKLNDMGITAIMDIDDYWLLNPSHPMYHMMSRQNMDSNIISNLKAANYVTTTTYTFAEEISKHNKNVIVLPNFINTNEKQYNQPTEKSDRIRIGWLGGSSHLGDIELLKGLVSKLNSDKLMDKIQFVLCGFDLSGKVSYINQQTGQLESRPIHPMESVWYKYEKIFTNDYKSVSPEYKKFLTEFKEGEYDDVANEPYRRVWTKSINTYATSYSLMDISLAPLEVNPFNKMKSELKAIEAGVYKKTLIAQDFGPYQFLLNAHEKGGGVNINADAFLVNPSHNHKEWYRFIKKLVQNPSLINTLGENLHETITHNYSADKITDKRAEFYHNILRGEDIQK